MGITVFPTPTTTTSSSVSASDSTCYFCGSIKPYCNYYTTLCNCCEVCLSPLSTRTTCFKGIECAHIAPINRCCFWVFAYMSFGTDVCAAVYGVDNDSGDITSKSDWQCIHRECVNCTGGTTTIQNAYVNPVSDGHCRAVLKMLRRGLAFCGGSNPCGFHTIVCYNPSTQAITKTGCCCLFWADCHCTQHNNTIASNGKGMIVSPTKPWNCCPMYALTWYCNTGGYGFNGTSTYTCNICGCSCDMNNTHIARTEDGSAIGIFFHGMQCGGSGAGKSPHKWAVVSLQAQCNSLIPKVREIGQTCGCGHGSLQQLGQSSPWVTSPGAGYDGSEMYAATVQWNRCGATGQLDGYNQRAYIFELKGSSIGLNNSSQESQFPIKFVHGSEYSQGSCANANHAMWGGGCSFICDNSFDRQQPRSIAIGATNTVATSELRAPHYNWKKVCMNGMAFPHRVFWTTQCECCCGSHGCYMTTAPVGDHLIEIYACCCSANNACHCLTFKSFKINES